LVKHFSQWDYEFEFIYNVAIDKNVEQLGLYMRLREVVLRSEFNKAKKDILSGISAELGISSQYSRGMGLFGEGDLQRQGGRRCHRPIH
jgi:hypothetical protein